MKFSNKMRFSKGWFTGLVLGVASSAVVVYATVVTVPNTFAPDTPILAADMNANFAAIAGCPTDMVPVGSICVDIYEASVTEDLDGTQPAATSRCDVNGNDCSATDNTGNQSLTAIYAQSVAGVIPSVGFTWFQAQQACANVGKRLLTNAEYQMAAAGTQDPGAAGNGTDACNTNTGGIVQTGNAGANCQSNWGASDMVGNVWEWVADFHHGDPTFDMVPPTTVTFGGLQTANGAYGNDTLNNWGNAAGQGSGANFPAAIIRGGTFDSGGGAGVFSAAVNKSPSLSDSQIGFRCAR